MNNSSAERNQDRLDVEVATFRRDSSAETQKTLDINGLGEEDLESLRTKDAFMYYSITCIRRAAMSGKNVSDGTSPLPTTANHEHKKAKLDTVVKRQSRISFESDLFTQMSDSMGDIIEDDSCDDSCDDEDDGDDIVLEILSMKALSMAVGANEE